MIAHYDGLIIAIPRRHLFVNLIYQAGLLRRVRIQMNSFAKSFTNSMRTLCELYASIWSAISQHRPLGWSQAH